VGSIPTFGIFPNSMPALDQKTWSSAFFNTELHHQTLNNRRRYSR